MLTSSASAAVVLGHSERRQLFGETDEALARKVPAALDAGLQPILCVGETEEERDGGETEDVLRRQLEADLAGVGRRAVARRRRSPTSRSGRSAPAAPRRPSRPRRRSRFVRSLVAERDAEAAAERADPLRRLGEARQRRRAARAARDRRGAGRRRLASTPPTSSRSCAAA